MTLEVRKEAYAVSRIVKKIEPGTAKSNMYDNRPEETKYIYTDDDSQGNQLNGDDTYAITFAKGEVPPVKGVLLITALAIVMVQLAHNAPVILTQVGAASIEARISSPVETPPFMFAGIRG
jgi:Protein of unknown function (DUF1214)